MTKSPVEVPVAETHAQAGVVEAEGFFRQNFRRVAMAGAIVALTTSCSLIDRATDGVDDDNVDSNPGAVVDVDEACEDAKLMRVAANPAEYDRWAFLPFPEAAIDEEVIDNTDEASAYINSLFNVEPLGNQVDKVSLAAVMAAITEPANDNGVVDPSYSYLSTFRSRLASYMSEDADEVVARDCAETYRTMVEAGELEENWATNGETLTRLSPIREFDEDGENWRLVGFRVSEVVTDENLSGIVFADRSQSDEIDGLTEVMVHEETGVMYVKGAPVETGEVRLEDAEAEANDGGSDRGGQGPRNGESDGTHNGDCGGTQCGTSDCGSCNPGGNPPGGNPPGGNRPGGNPPGNPTPPTTTPPPPTSTTTTTTTTTPTTTTTTMPTQPTHPPGDGPPTNL